MKKLSFFIVVLIALLSITADCVAFSGFVNTAGAGVNDAGTALVGHWDFETGSGSTAYDQSGYGNDGTLTNMEAGDWVSGKVGSYALNFDGVNEYVGCGNGSSLNPTNTISIAAWAKRTGTSANQYVVSKGGYYNDAWAVADYVHSTTRVSTSVSTCYAWEIGPLPLDTWQHYVMVYDKDSIGKIYVDGAFLENLSCNNLSIPVIATQVSIGSKNGGASDTFEGTIDDVRIYNKVLTQGEINQLYDMGEPCDGTSYWEGAPGITERFEDGIDDWCTVVKSGTDWAIDETGNGTVNTYDSAQAKNGTYSFSVEDDSAAAAETAFFSGDITDDADYSVEFWFRHNASSWANTDLARIFYTAGSTEFYTELYYNGSNYIIRLHAQSGGYQTGTYSIAANTWYKIKLDYNSGGTTTCKIHDSSDVLQETLTESSTASATTSIVYFGVHTSTMQNSNTYTIYMDDIKMNTDGD